MSTTKEIIETKEKAAPGAIIKSHDEEGDFFYVTWPGARAEEFETEAEAQAYLADLQAMFKRERAKANK